MARPMIAKQARIEIKGVNPYVHITAQEANLLQANWRKPLPVCVQIAGQPTEPWHINMVPMGDGDFYLYLHNEVRQAASAKVGDVVAVTVWFDEAYRSGPTAMPAWFSEALRASEAASRAWKSLIPSRQKEVLRYLLGLKSAQARTRNLALTMRALSGEPIHFLGRNWRNGK